MAERQIGPFLLGDKLGGGGMGVVYRATYTKTGQQVAVKLLPPDQEQNPKLIKRFDRELEILKKLKHPNIVQCFGGGRLAKQRFFAMELVDGGSLAAVLKDRGRLPWEDVVRYGMQICSALEYAHEHGIIHRDLKPDNLLITKKGVLKLGDFGVARDVGAMALTAPGRTVGTYAYMAPEQIRGEPPVSHKTDLYALGCVLFEMLTGKPPFESDGNPATLFLQHLEKKPPRVATVALDCPIWLDTLIGQLMEKDPEKRPWDASAVEQALQEVEAKVAGQASIAQHAVSGQPSQLTVTGDVSSVRQILKRKKKKKIQKGPFYERTWFLATCLVAVLSLVTWSLWPLSEEQLFARADALMQSEDTTDWLRAESEYLQPLQEKYPTGRYATQVQQYIDKIEMNRAEERMKFNNRLGREPSSEGERLYADARQYEQFGDRVSALEKYRSMIPVLETSEKARPFVNLARREIARLEQAGGANDDRLKVANDALDRAEKLYQQGQVLEARKIWNSIITLYETNRELAPQVERAQARLDGKEPLKETPAAPNGPATPAAPAASPPGK